MAKAGDGAGEGPAAAGQEWEEDVAAGEVPQDLEWEWELEGEEPAVMQECGA